MGRLTVARKVDGADSADKGNGGDAGANQEERLQHESSDIRNEAKKSRVRRKHLTHRKLQTYATYGFD